ncbi:MAG: hypothetical protein K2P37_09830, partial [Oscillospiraceae bacterium]|nr:hypothetical protein [Oscillospiraceae bacterium]
DDTPAAPASVTGEDGWRFTGWTWEGQTIPTKTVPAKVTKSMEYTANWTKASFPYTIEYYFDNELGRTMEGEALFEESILKAAGLTDISDSASEGGKTYALDKVVGADNTITVNADENVVKIYYDLDEKGPNGEKPDGTPDKYQVEVTFVVRNGYWSDLKDEAKFSTPQTRWLTRYKDGEPAVDGTATVTDGDAPAVGRLPYDGYRENSGIWTPSLPMDITEAQTFTYAYLPGSYAYTVNYYYDNVLASSQTVNGTGTFGAGIPYDASTPKTYAGRNYMLERIDGIGKKITANSAENVVNIYYTLDAIGPDGGPDGIADKYQARVTFVVENGTWTGGTTSQSAVVTLMKDGVPAAAADGGVYQITDGDVPDGTPNAGYLNTGAWRDGRNPANAIINGDTTFTFTYALIPPVPPVTPPGGGGGGGGGTTIPDGPTPLVPDPGTTIADQDVPLAAPGLNNTDHFD